MKRCNRCGEEKELACFRRGSQCRACDKIVKRKWETDNREKHLVSKRRRSNAARARNLVVCRAKEQAYRDANRATYQAKQNARARKRRLRDPEKYRELDRQRIARDREGHLADRRERNKRYRARQREYERQRWRTDEIYKLKSRLRWFLRTGLKGGGKTNSALKLLGCSIEDFRLYLESKFEPGMSWDNYGFDGWHIDHIMPLAIFDLTKPEHQKRAFHFSNMQPLWAFDNMSKRDKVLNPQMPLI